MKKTDFDEETFFPVTKVLILIFSAIAAFGAIKRCSDERKLKDDPAGGNGGKNQNQEIVQTSSYGFAYVPNPFWRDFYNSGVFGNRVIPDKTFFLEPEDFCICPSGNIRKHLLSSIEVQKQKDAKRASYPINQQFFHKAVFFY